MKSINKIYKDLKTASPHNFSDEDFKDYQRTINFQNEFINFGVTNWSFEEMDNFSGEQITYNLNVWHILSQRRADFFAKAIDFKENPTDVNFNELINLMYINSLPAIAYCIKKDKSLESYGFLNKVIHYFLCSLSFFPIEEQKILLQTLSLYDETYYKCKPLPQSSETLMPLAFHLASDILIDDECSNLITEGKNKFSFNKFYQNAYENYLSKNEETAKKIFNDLCDYHLKNCMKSKIIFNEFEYLQSQPIPFEIIVLLKMRQKNGLSIDFINHPLIKDIVTLLVSDYSFDFSEETKIIRLRVFNYLNYQIN